MLSRKRSVGHPHQHDANALSKSGTGQMRQGQEADAESDERAASAASVVRFVRACLDLLPVAQVQYT